MYGHKTPSGRMGSAMPDKMAKRTAKRTRKTKRA
jgi:hypothetical protein